MEMCVDGTWGTLCDDHWDNRDAGVICHMLGYHRESEHTDHSWTTASDSVLGHYNLIISFPFPACTKILSSMTQLIIVFT